MSFAEGTLFLVVPLNKNIKILVNYVVGPLIMLILFYSVFLQLQKQPDWKETLGGMLGTIQGNQRWKLYMMFGLMLINWGLESLKWKIALSPLQPIGFLRAYKAILAGTCIAAFTPNRVGEYLGRMLFVETGNKLNSIAPTILCSMGQMLITLFAGSLGIYLFSLYPYHFNVHWITPSFFRSAMMITIIGALVLSLVYFGFDPLLRKINEWLKRNRKNVSIPDNFSFSSLATILTISAIRYSVFIIQYYLLFTLFGMELTGKQVFTGVSVMFVLMALVPTLTFLTDLGFRWAAGIQVFQAFTANTAGILAVSLSIWFINLIIPALIGSLLILRIKLFTSK